jgi:carboxyl-terminal processing protease
MKKISIFILFICTFSCKEDEKSDPSQVTNFETFWKNYNDNYAGFAVNPVDWDSLYKIYRPKITSTTSDKELFTIFSNLLAPLKDGHAFFDAGSLGNYSYYFEQINKKPRNFLTWQIVKDKYLSDVQTNNKNIAYGGIGSDIGYIWIAGFTDNQKDYETFTDNFIEKYKSSKGVIIDARQNAGGNETFAQAVAGRFTEQKVLYRYGKFRVAGSRTSLGNFFSLELNPSGTAKFTKKVIFLTNRATFSAGEDFTLMMRELPNVVHVGDTTGGGVATNPSMNSLPNGWNYYVSRVIEYDSKQKPITGGIIPDKVVSISKGDLDAGRDTILEEAIKMIRQ